MTAEEIAAKIEEYVEAVDQLLLKGRRVRSKGISLSERRKLAHLISDVDAEFVVLIGSWARGAQSADSSDIDLLVGVSAATQCPSVPRMHIICLSEEELAGRAREGDDFVLWCLRYGIPLSGRRRWNSLQNLLAGAPWPFSHRKFDLASKQFRYALDLLRMGDPESAQDELKVGLGHLARGLLIDRRVFPLSRPEVPDQLRSVGFHGLASALDAAATEDLSPEHIEAFVDLGSDLIAGAAKIA